MGLNLANNREAVFRNLLKMLKMGWFRPITLKSEKG